MTCGIYALYWENQDLMYIGQSQCIEQRFTTHRSLFTRGHYNYKLRKTYEQFGDPEYLIIEKCSISDLDVKEIEYIQVFDSINKGLNIVSGGGSILGYTSGKCLHSKETLIEGFMLLGNPNISLKEIREITGISESTLQGIKYGKRHHWLHEEFPYEWETICNNIKLGLYQSSSQEKRFKVKAIVISPEGVEYEITNGKSFAEKHGLNVQHFNAVVRGSEKQHKGWTLKRKEVSDG